MLQRVFLLIALCLSCSLYAEQYAIIFNSGTSDSSQEIKKLEDVVYSATDNCVNQLISYTKIYRAKEGFGIKGGTGSVAGKLVLGLNAQYNITQMTIYAASYGGKNKDSVNAIIVCGDTMRWQAGTALQITPYSIAAPGKTDSIVIQASQDKNNRFYIQQIIFTADDPFPGVAKITAPKSVIFEEAVIIDGQPETDAMDIPIIAHCTNGDDLILGLEKGTIFSLGTNLLPSSGGNLTISYTVATAAEGKGNTVSDELSIKAKGSNGQFVTQTIPVSVHARMSNSSDFTVDSSCMHIGPMPGNYYQPAQGQKDSALKSALSDIIHCGVRYRYGSGKNHTWNGFFFTDRDTVTQQVMDMYSNEKRYFNLYDTTASVSNMDIEHMLPKSWWGGTVNEAYCDLFHLVPADYSANRSKSNHAPGIPSDSTFNNGSFVTGSGSQYDLTRVFCPADEYKGDFARAYFYIVTCYDTLQWVTTGEAGKAMTNSSYLDFQPWLQDLLLSWHRMDPVSEKEKTRAIAVNKIQGNRNPFIDYPQLVEYIWGNKQGTAVNFNHLTQSFGDPYNEITTSIDYPMCPEQGILKVLEDGQVVLMVGEQTYSITGIRQY